MKLSVEQIENLKKSLEITQDVELNCNECLETVGEYAELQLKGIEVSAALQQVEHHLGLCGECHQEYESLLKALVALDGASDSSS